jgi:hypothetical protein
VERLQDTKPVAGSAEAILLDAIRASAPYEPTLAQRRRVLERVLDRRRGHRHGGAMVLRPIVVLGVLLMAGVTAAAAFGHGWIAQALRTLSGATPAEAMTTEPVYRPHRRAAEPAEPSALEPDQAEPVAEAAPTPGPVVTHSAPSPRLITARPHPIRTEDPSLVVDAIRALRTDRDSRRATALLAEYSRTYPRGALSEEAVALSIEAAAASRSPSAATFAAQYLREYPHGRFRRAAEQALEQRQP